MRTISSAGWTATIVDSEGMPPDSVIDAEIEVIPTPTELPSPLNPTDMIRVLLRTAVNNRADENVWRMTMRQVRTLITMGAQVAYAKSDQALIAEYNALKKMADELEAALLTNTLKIAP